ncbi:shikimate dehydrogenase family protein [Pleomorphovibrio marinus]|uniref:shikimate dehydrogenase family protein n=1 Tax=Pleomorphovibrio marinus TaxID=2164132 RepID=UPI000E0C39C9|nr:shikimate dehydrogenase [Pleomorphovibrio marinus]
MKKYGLIGFPLSHSFSKKYFSEKFVKEGLSDRQYELYELPNIDAFPILLKKEKGLLGLNVTIPYKVEVIPYLDQLDPACEAIGAVNCIKISTGRLTGFNTDYIGFKESLQNWLPQIKQKALVLGTGGASRAVVQALQDLKIPFLRVSRNDLDKMDVISYMDLLDNKEILEEYTLIINTTPLGTFPNVESMPAIPVQYINDRHRVYDLVYNPEKTYLMKTLEAKGAVVKNGLEMLHLQAEAAWKIWN